MDPRLLPKLKREVLGPNPGSSPWRVMSLCGLAMTFALTSSIMMVAASSRRHEPAGPRFTAAPTAVLYVPVSPCPTRQAAQPDGSIRLTMQSCDRAPQMRSLDRIEGLERIEMTAMDDDGQQSLTGPQKGPAGP